MIFFHRASWFALAYLSSLPVAVLATAEEPPAPVKITLHPAAEPTPALRYQLLPGRLEQIPGNAAVHYGKVTAEETAFFGPNYSGQSLHKIVEIEGLPISQLKAEKIGMPGGGPQGGIQDDIRRAAYSTFCDWQLPIGSNIPFYKMPIAELQQTRVFGRILAAQARLQIAEGDYAAAIESLQSGYSMGRHVATGETIIHKLYGVVICRSMSEQILDFVQQTEAPNLYWALLALPNPLIDVRSALDVERATMELSFPELREIETARLTDEEWRELFLRISKVIDEFSGGGPEEAPWPLPEQIEQRRRQLAPQAKQTLVAHGWAPEAVDVMADYQVATLYSLEVFRAMFDGIVKYFSLPYPEAMVGINAAIDRANRDQLEIIPLGHRTVMSIGKVRASIARIEREITVLRVLEALRIYAANHSDQLPDRLEDVAEVPVPNDPITGKSFVYVRDENKAQLQGPPLFAGDAALDYEITMVPVQ